MSHRIVFSLAVGNEAMSEQARCLVRSIRRFYPDAPILAYVTNQEKLGLPTETVAFFESQTTLRTGPFPHPEYKISSKLKAMALASEEFEFENLVLLDSDTVLVDTFDAFLDGAKAGDVYAKPVDIANKWNAIGDWERVASATGYEMPWQRTVSTVDKRRIAPFYNAGVVMTTSNSFPAEWLALTKTVYEVIEDGDSFFSDQVALGLLADRYDFVEMSDLENYPLHLYQSISDDALLIHYHSYGSLTKVENRRFDEIITETGLRSKIPLTARVLSNIYEPRYHADANLLYSAFEQLKQDGLTEFVKTGAKLFSTPNSNS